MRPVVKTDNKNSGWRTNQMKTRTARKMTTLVAVAALMLSLLAVGMAPFGQTVAAAAGDGVPEQITFDAAASGGTIGGTASWSHTVGAGSNRILVVGLSFFAYPRTDSVTYGTRSLTRQVLNDGVRAFCEIWILVDPPP